MKKLSVFALLGLLVLGFAATASAADIKATGSWQINAYSLSGFDFMDKGGYTTATGNPSGKSINIEQRMRTAFQFIANENLKAVLDTQIGTANWGSSIYQMNSGRQAIAGAGSGDANGGAIMLRKGYLDFKWPGTKVNFLVGFQTVGLPAAFGGGSAILDDQMAAAIMVTPITDNVKLLAGFSRLVDANTAQQTTASTLSGSHNALDAVFAAVPIDFKGVNVTPFAAYASMGRDAVAAVAASAPLGNAGGLVAPNSSNTEGMRGYWGGVATTITALDGFKIMADFNYGKVTYNNKNNNVMNSGGRSGWLADVAVDYTGLKMMTPSLFAVYSSGEKGNSTDHDGKSGRMPVVGTPQNWAVGSFFFGDRNFISRSSTSSSTDRAMGFWTIGASLKDMTFIDKLSHTAHVLYAKGTNDKNFLNENIVAGGTAGNGAIYGRMLTEKDSLWEVDFNTKYMIYDELSVMLDLGYINMNYNKDLWSNAATSTLPAATRANIQNHGSDDAYRIAVGLNYNF